MASPSDGAEPSPKAAGAFATTHWSVVLTQGQTAAVLRFLAMEGRAYTVQFRDAAEGGEWARLADVPATDPNRIVELSDPLVAAGAQRFYRLVTPRAP